MMFLAPLTFKKTKQKKPPQVIWRGFSFKNIPKESNGFAVSVHVLNMLDIYLHAKFLKTTTVH